MILERRGLVVVIGRVEDCSHEAMLAWPILAG